MRKLKFTLSVDSVKQVQKELLDYKKSLQRKCREFVKRLSEQGIETAKVNLHQEYVPHIMFRTELDPIEYGCRGLMVAMNSSNVIRRWITKDGIRIAYVSPIMMSEFGSGLDADNSRGSKFGMGTGTFPEQKHAFDIGGWFWQDLNFEWHHSYGERATMPMAHAYDAMIAVIDKTAKEVFQA